MAKLIILPPAARYLKKLKEKPLKDKFQAIIDQLLLDPFFGEPKTGSIRQKINPAPQFPLFPDCGMCKSVAWATKNQQMAMAN